MTHKLLDRLVDTHLREMRAWREHELRVRAQPPMRPQPKPEDHAAAQDPGLEFWKDVAAWQAEKLARFEPYPKPGTDPVVQTVIGSDGNIYGFVIPDLN